MKAYERLLKYVVVRTPSDEESSTVPSSQCQFDLARLLKQEMEEMGLSDKLTEIENKFDLLLKEQFDVSKRNAKKLYKIKKRSEYTLELHEILDKLGLEH